MRPFSGRSTSLLLAGLALLALLSPAAAQPPRRPPTTGVYKATVQAHWFQDNTRFWYRNDLRGGAREFIVVDAVQGTRGPAFDHDKLAAGLSAAAGGNYRGNRLPFDALEFTGDGKAVRFRVDNVSWQCDLNSYECKRAEGK